ncbi:MAG: hypothetical protein M3257_09395 [Actinomycetota bacterium]|nr:hypothetical protein [Actinomycetota bacterium]
MILLLGSPFMLLLTVHGVATRLRVRQRAAKSVDFTESAASEECGVRLPYGAAVWSFYYLWPLVMIIFFGPLLAASLANLTTTPGDVGALVQMGVTGLATGYASCFVVDLLRRRLRRGVIVLSPVGVYHRSWTFDSFFPWESVLFVDGGEADGPLVELAIIPGRGSWYRRISKLWKQAELAFDPNMAVPGKWLSVDPALLYWALRYYHEHPEARGELAGTAGVRRLRDGAVLS